jgi:hypothetical protein
MSNRKKRLSLLASILFMVSALIWAWNAIFLGVKPIKIILAATYLFSSILAFIQYKTDFK